MMFEIKDNTLVVRLKALPSGVKYINLFGIIFCRYTTQINDIDWNHELIHSHQWYETLFIGMLLWYPIEFIVRWIKYRDADEAYRNISFESEAYGNQYNRNYLEERELFTWMNYL